MSYCLFHAQRPTNEGIFMFTTRELYVGNYKLSVLLLLAVPCMCSHRRVCVRLFQLNGVGWAAVAQLSR